MAAGLPIQRDSGQANPMRISPNTAASRYRYALEKLRAELGER